VRSSVWITPRSPAVAAGAALIDAGSLVITFSLALATAPTAGAGRWAFACLDYL
jgi:hypothetical protein